MRKNYVAYLIGPIFIATAIFANIQLVHAQCGTYFKPGYRAVGKLTSSPFTGRNYQLGDWTGDGRSDFWNLLTVGLSEQRQIKIYPALPTGGWNWDAPIVYTINIPGAQFPDVSGETLRDFDSDGRIDMLITTSGSPGTLVLLRNANDGSLQPGVASLSSPTSTDFARPIGFADVNSDGRLDRIYFQQNRTNFSEAITYSLLEADGSFGSPVTILAHTPETGVTDSNKAVGDFDGDGKIDIAYFAVFGSNRELRVLKNNGNSTFTLLPGTAATASGTEAADFNNDGRADILARSSGQFVVYTAQANGSFTSTTHTAANVTSLPNLFKADLTGDGRLDLLNLGTQDYEVFINDPTLGFVRNYVPRRIQTDGSLFHMFEDFTGDGKADIYDASHNTRNAFNEEVVAIKTNVCSPRGETRSLNFDSTGPHDIALWNGANGMWSSLNGNWPVSGTIFVRGQAWGSASLGDVPAPGDFDGDGKTDYAVFRNSEGKWYVLLSSNSSWMVFHFGLPGDIPVPGDYNDGGMSDFVVFRPSDGNWYIWYNESQSFSAAHWGTNGDRPVPADYDGDSKTDIAVFRPSTGDWYYVRSSDQAYGIVHWGTTGDVPLPADYDGDGLADLTVFRSGSWFILRSTNGTYAIYSWGTTGDIPLPFYELGEIAWPVVYRPSNSRWYHPRYVFSVVTTPGSGSPVYMGLANN